MEFFSQTTIEPENMVYFKFNTTKNEILDHLRSSNNNNNNNNTTINSKDSAKFLD